MEICGVRRRGPAVSEGTRERFARITPVHASMESRFSNPHGSMWILRIAAVSTFPPGSVTLPFPRLPRCHSYRRERTGFTPAARTD